MTYIPEEITKIAQALNDEVEYLIANQLPFNAGKICIDTSAETFRAIPTHAGAEETPSRISLAQAEAIEGVVAARNQLLNR